jgi:hypothetical protein
LGLAADSAHKCAHDALEHALTVETVLGREVHRTVQLENSPPTLAVREEVDADEVRPEGGSGAEGD